MTIEEIREKRLELNRTIADLVKQFMRETRVRPRSIELQPAEYWAYGEPELTYCNVMVHLEEI